MNVSAVSNEVPPAHLNVESLEKALEKAQPTKSNVKIENVKWQLVNMKGGNFCSNIYRVNGNYRSDEAPKEENVQQFNFIIKDMIMEIAEVGTNEVIMFEKILPEMQRILAEAKDGNFKTSSKMGASCFHSVANAEHEFYILEDLNVQGYSLGNRCDGLTLEQAYLAVEKIAKFHAVSMVYGQQHPNIIANLSAAHFAEGASDRLAKAILQNGMQFAIEIMKPLDIELSKKMEKIFNNFDEEVKRIVDPKRSTYNVLNHGDLWVTNILFKAEAADAIFVDFQNVFWGSPAYDLHYLFHTSLSLELLQTQRYDLLIHYYKTFKMVLESLKFAGTIPTLSDLKREMRRCALIGYYAALCELPICCMSEENAKDFDLESFSNEKTMRKLILESPKVCKFINYAVQYFDEIGLMDQ